jgi:hypothetical protein
MGTPVVGFIGNTKVISDSEIKELDEKEKKS